METVTRINLGCGLTHFPGKTWINCDRNGDADTICEAFPLPFETDFADEIWAIHLLEHLHRGEAGRALYEWFRVLKPGGKLVIEVPCLDKIAQLIVDGEKNIRLTTMGLFGDPRDLKPDMMHKWCWSKLELTDTLVGVNFQDIQVHEPIFHMPQRDMQLTARKPL